MAPKTEQELALERTYELARKKKVRSTVTRPAYQQTLTSVL